MQVSPEHAERLRNPKYTGGSLIVAPTSEIIAGPLGAEEATLYADCDLEICVRRKLRQDLAGHDNRAEIFQQRVNRSAPTLYATWKPSRRMAANTWVIRRSASPCALSHDSICRVAP